MTQPIDFVNSRAGGRLVAAVMADRLDDRQPPELKMNLTTPTTSFLCEIRGGLAPIILNQPDRGNPVDGVFCREFSLAMTELSAREDVRAVLISARGKMFSVGGDI